MKNQKKRTKLVVCIGLLLIARISLSPSRLEAQTCPIDWQLRTWDWNGKSYPGNGGSILVGGVTVTFTHNPLGFVLPTPAVTNVITAGTGGNTLQLQHRGGPVPAVLTMAFTKAAVPTPVQGLNFILLDVDCDLVDPNCGTGTWRDQVTVTSTPVLPQGLTLTPTPGVNSISGANNNIATGDNGDITATLPGAEVGVKFTANVDSVTLSFANANGSVAHGIAIRSFSFCEANPTQALVTDLTSTTADGASVIEWTTASEVGALGFHVMRREARTGEYQRVNAELVPALQNAQGGTYRFVDETAERGKRYSYKVIEVTMEGNQQEYGPFQARASHSDVSPEESARLHQAGFSATPHALNALPPERASEASLRVVAAQARTGVAKLGVREAGVYFVTSAEMAEWLGMAEAQVRAFLRARQFSLRNEGRDVAYYPASDQSGLYFYGQETKSPFSRDNVYWLQQSKLFRGTVMAVVDGGAPAHVAIPPPFTYVQRREENKIALTSMEASPSSDFWYWDSVGGSGTKTFPVGLDDPAPSPGTASLRLVGRGTTVEPHPLRVTVNGFVLGEVRPVGTGRFSLELPVAQSSLVAGTNDVLVTRVPEAGASDGTVFIDAIEVTYSRQARARGDGLTVLSGSEPTVTVTGFTRGPVIVLDVTDPRFPAWISGVNVSGTADVQASFEPRTADRRYFLASSAALRKPVWAVPAGVSTLRADSAGASYLVIAPAAFEQAAEALAAHRAALGAKVVTAEEIYDEFGNGMPSPEAIRAFLSYAWSNWNTRPRFVALVGNGTFDYRDYWGKGDNFLPPLLVTMNPGGLVSSDTALADMDGDGVPEMAVGRIPIVDNEQGLAYVRKVVAHERSAGPWAAKALMVADKSDAIDYSSQSEAVSAFLPAAYQKSTVYLSQTAIAEARQSFRAALNDGVGIVNYLGHGGTDRLAKAGLLTLDDVPSLTNQDRFSVMSALTCVLNRFEYPGYASLGEMLTLKETGGAIAVWSSSSLSFPDALQPLNTKLFQAYAKGESSIGEAVLGAMAAYAAEGYTGNHLRTFTLIGDPAVGLAKK